ncbi:hypothetical protein [Paracoccus sp. (in: a-proteobacteria)]|uniref:hypothetical protein n=1 Tax=Paracoccus sp. TaxID=267 RepID=UPI002AFF4618|nr:hypothetical protein [Paracoccus sp. (in: a-proteobacteria)]
MDGPVSRAPHPSGRSRDRQGAAQHRLRPLRHRRHLVEGTLWHGTWQGEESDIRRIDSATGAGLERLEMPAGTGVSGLEPMAANGSSAVMAAAAN